MTQATRFTLGAFAGTPLPVRLAIVVQQVSNYHAARFRAVNGAVSHLTVLSVLNDADFAEFLAKDVTVDVVRVCSGDRDYANAIASGTVSTRVVEVLDEVDPDVVAVSGWSFPESLSAIAWARMRERRVVVMSASQAHDGARLALREAIKRRVVSACDAALVAAQPHADYAIALGIPEYAVFFGYDAVDNRHFEMGSEAARIDHECRFRYDLPGRYLLASGRFIPKKNFPRLIQAFSDALKRHDTGHDLVILGDGPERSGIEATITAEGLWSRVHLPGFRRYEELPALYGLSDGFLHVSLAEQWGLVVNEAAAAGLPLVVSVPCGASSTLVTKANGRIVDPSNADDIAEAIVWLMALSPPARAAYGAASRRIVADWGPERFASGLTSAVEAALARPARGLSTFDRLIFDQMSRMRIRRVT